MIKKELKYLKSTIGCNLPKYVDMTLYPEISKEIPSKFLEIEEVFKVEEIYQIIANFKPYLDDEVEHEIQPILGVLGGSVICIGVDSVNNGEIFYYDMDFGVFKLDDNIDEFLNKLVQSIA